MLVKVKSAKWTEMPDCIYEDKRVTANSIALLGAIIHNSKESGNEWICEKTSRAKLCKSAHISERSFASALNLLMECGYLEKKSNNDSTGRKSYNTYIVNRTPLVPVSSDSKSFNCVMKQLKDANLKNGDIVVAVISSEDKIGDYHITINDKKPIFKTKNELKRYEKKKVLKKLSKVYKNNLRGEWNDDGGSECVIGGCL